MLEACNKIVRDKVANNITLDYHLKNMIAKCQIMI